MYMTKREKLILMTLTTLIFIAAVGVFIYPVYWLFSMSLKSQIEAFRTPPSFIFIPTFGHYVRLFRQADFLRYYTNSIVVGVGATALGLLLGVPEVGRGHFLFDGLVAGLLAGVVKESPEAGGSAVGSPRRDRQVPCPWRGSYSVVTVIRSKCRPTRQVLGQ